MNDIQTPLLDRDTPRNQPESERAPGPTGRLAISVVHAYQLARSGRPTGCRYLPTCSEYAIEAISTHGTAKGSLLALRRLSRCTPWGGHGIDPVPTGRTSCTHR
jgi:putative membrane protein insertion efficiency factor